MTRESSITSFRGVSVLLCCLIAGFGMPLWAAKQPKDEPEAYRYTYDYLFMIDALIRSERYQKAREELDSLLDRVKQKPNETALVRQAYGYLSIGLNDYKAAIDHFLFAIDSGALPENIKHGLRYTLAQLLYQEGRSKEGLVQLDKWLAQEKQPHPQSRVLQARLYHALNRWKKAVKALKIAISEVDQPNESWYQMLVGIYLEKERLKQAAPILQKMVKLFPDKAQYWQQLAGVLLHLGRDSQATAMLSLAAEKGLLKEESLLRLARLTISQNRPMDAAELLQSKLVSREIKHSSENLSLLVDAWLLARDQQQALVVLEQLATIDNSGKPQLRAGRVLMESEQWKAAAAQLKRGIKLSDKPSFDDWMILGNANYRNQKHAAAKSAFEAARLLAGNTKQRELADSWLEYLTPHDQVQ